MIRYRLHRANIKNYFDGAYSVLVEEIWAYVDQHHGEFATNRHGVDFYVPEDIHLFLLIKYPMLVLMEEEKQYI